MKATLALSLLLVSPAYADSLQLLQSLPSPGFSSVGAPACAAIGFTARGTIYGACRYKIYTVSCRYCQLATRRYVITWDSKGLHPALGPLCATTNAALVNRVVVTYKPGYSASNCVVDFSPHDETLLVDGYIFQYVTARSDGSELLDLNNRASYLWTP
jgi:hypothetical protein